ncbi:prevent-host-death protein [Chryseobacterium urinae]|uniref:Prevent-host-death protein n=1 Tax=Chryseobacterium urinae TaxID=3058400 RepID=A0ABT8U2G3_9FLAO|nr:prevent-host-death protein [Chryseobacterium sp. APV1]MDO3424370.1 prevent-host-death protein [Chryseobacterium sp. APV1]
MMNTKRFKILQDFSNIQNSFKMNFRNRAEVNQDKKESENNLQIKDFKAKKSEPKRKVRRSALEIWEEIEELASES